MISSVTKLTNFEALLTKGMVAEMRNTVRCSKGRRGMAWLLSAALLAACLPVVPAGAEAVETAGETEPEESSYAAYQERNQAAGHPDVEILLDAGDLLPSSEGAVLAEDDAGQPVVITGEEGFTDWKVTVEKAGLYRIRLRYLPLPGEETADLPLKTDTTLPLGNNEDVERQLLLDGETPFDEAGSVLFSRAWKDAGPIERIDDNDIRPEQVEISEWREQYVQDSLGYYGEALYFYLSAGEHTLRLVSVREPMAVASIVLDGSEDITPTYEEYLAQHSDQPIIDQVPGEEGGIALFEAETPTSKSDSSIYAVADRSSAQTSPSHYSRTRLNNIGGDKWQMPGQWITWTLDVPETGLYRIVLRSRQNAVRGMYTSRKLYIDGELPFAEAANLPFNYSDSWIVEPLGGTESPYLFYLEEGQREITMSVSLGSLGEVISQAENCLSLLNEAYWELLTVLGADPDPYRDYDIDKYHPEILDIFRQQSALLYSMVDGFEKATGQKGSYTAPLSDLALLLEKMVEKPRDIPSSFTSFKDGISSLGNWISESREQPLNIDYIVLAGEDSVLPPAEAGFIENFLFHVKQFLASFVDSYNTYSSDGSDAKTSVTVWIGSGSTGGRDQAQVLRQMINNDFTPNHPDIAINLQLIPSGTILTASLSGKGPDVALQISGSDPVNYAMRNAVLDLTAFSDFETVRSRFQPSALTPFSYAKTDDHTGVYALPETQSFYMLFYRKDILEGLGIDPEQLETWQDIIATLPQLQKQNMTFGLPATINTYAMFLYQHDGEFYKNGGRQSNLDADISLDAFREWTNYYVSYGLDLEYSFENRFRTGEMPLAVADYTSYNLLSVSAPEIRGLWGMTQVPGVRQEDGSISRVSPATGAGAIIMSNTEAPQACWEFIKWWTDAPAQEQFGRELESVLGTAGRYNTANIEALQKLPWPAADRKTLLQQWEDTQGIPEVPGGYYTSRYLDFAMRDVVNNNEDAREALLNNVEPITTEIQLKRNELGLQ